MNARAALLDQWRKVLVFSIGPEDFDFSQLPDVRRLPRKFPIAPEQASKYGYADDHGAASDYLGYVLGIAALKLTRGYGEEALVEPLGASLCCCGCWLPAITKAVRVLDERDGDDSMSKSYLAVIGVALEMALCAPTRLPLLCSRLDALSNSALHSMAMEAVQGFPVADMLADLLEPPKVAR